MSFRLVHLVYQTKLKLGRSGRAILVCLAYHANDNKGLLCYPSLETLATETEMSVRQVIRVISSLQKIGILKKQIHGRNNYYFINERALNDNKSYPQAEEIGDTMSPIGNSIGDIPAQIGDIPASTHDIPAQIGDTMSPNRLNNIKDINKDINIREIFLNEKEEKERKETDINHISTIEAPSEILVILNQPKNTPTENGRRYYEESMKVLGASNIIKPSF
jgi:hypothetical protein